MFDEPTREASQENLRGWGDAFAGRGQALGLAIEELPRLFGHLEPVMRNLAADETNLEDFFGEMGDAARIVAPVSEQHAALFTSMADTFEAMGRDEGALKELISKSPPTMDAAIASFRVQRPFLADMEAFGEDFGPATEALRGALPTLNSAMETGIPVQRRAVELNEELGETLVSLRELAQAPGTTPGIRSIGATVATLNPQLRFYGPYVTVCNGPNYFFTFLGEHFSEPDSSGSSQRALLNTAARQEDAIGSMGANEPANGKNVREGNAAWAQDQPFARAITDTGAADCEAGQRGWLERNAKGMPPEYKIALDPRSPGIQGPTFTGRPRVPEGQTYTALPETSFYSNFPESEYGGR
jgi:hypothetical protein